MELRFSASARLLFLLSLHRLLAVRVGIQRFPLRNRHIQRLGLITCFQLRTATRCQQQDYQDGRLSHNSGFKRTIANELRM
jgi:hypothetical protein